MRNKLLSLLLLTLALCGVAGAQGTTQSGRSTLTHVGGVLDAVNYSYWSLQIDNASQVPAASPASFILRQGTMQMPDGRVISPFVGEIVFIGAGTVKEQVTLTSAVGCYLNAPVDSCTIAGNTVNAHGKGELITSATSGIGEAIGDAANLGGLSVYFEVDCGTGLVISAGATTTVASGPCVNLPQAFTNLGSSVFVNTTITTAASYSVGITGAATAFVTSCTALTAGTNCSQFVSAPAKTAVGSGFAAVLITPNVQPGAGAIHVKLWGYVGAQSNH